MTPGPKPFCLTVAWSQTDKCRKKELMAIKKPALKKRSIPPQNHTQLDFTLPFQPDQTHNYQPNDAITLGYQLPVALPQERCDFIQPRGRHTADNDPLNPWPPEQGRDVALTLSAS